MKARILVVFFALLLGSVAATAQHKSTDHKAGTAVQSIQYYYDPCKGPCPGGTWSQEMTAMIRVSVIGPEMPVPINAPDYEACTVEVRYRKIECNDDVNNIKRTAIQITGLCSDCYGSTATLFRKMLIRLLASDNPLGILRTTDGVQQLSFSFPGCWATYCCADNILSVDKQTEVTQTNGYWCRTKCFYPCTFPNENNEDFRRSCCVTSLQYSRKNCGDEIGFELPTSRDYNHADDCENAIEPEEPPCPNLGPSTSNNSAELISECSPLCPTLTKEDLRTLNDLGS